MANYPNSLQQFLQGFGLLVASLCHDLDHPGAKERQGKLFLEGNALWKCNMDIENDAGKGFMFMSCAFWI